MPAGRSVTTSDRSDRVLRSACRRRVGGKCICTGDLLAACHRRRHTGEATTVESVIVETISSKTWSETRTEVTSARSNRFESSDKRTTQIKTVEVHEAPSRCRLVKVTILALLVIIALFGVSVFAWTLHAHSSQLRQWFGADTAIRKVESILTTALRIWRSALDRLSTSRWSIWAHAVSELPHDWASSVDGMATVQHLQQQQHQQQHPQQQHQQHHQHQQQHKHQQHKQQHQHQQASDIRELRQALTSLEVRTSAIARSLEANEEWRLASGKSADQMTRVVDQMRSSLTSLEGDLVTLSGTVRSLRSHGSSSQGRVGPSASSQDAKRLDQLALQVEALKQALESLQRVTHQRPAAAAAAAATVAAGTVEADLMPNYALRSGGASIVSTRDSRPYRAAGSRLLSWLPTRVAWKRPSANLVLSSAPVQPGNCWPFVGFPGRLLVRLSHTIRISAVSIDHLSGLISYNNSVASAPQNFSVYALASGCAGRDEAQKLGSFVYNATAGPPTQTFRLAAVTQESYRYVELEIESNHGKPEYTCLYRFRVHGIM